MGWGRKFAGVRKVDAPRNKIDGIFKFEEVLIKSA